MNFTVRLWESMGVPNIFNKYLDAEYGRLPDSPYDNIMKGMIKWNLLVFLYFL